MDSPLAKALFKKQVGDEIELIKPDSSSHYYEVTKIEYLRE